MIIKVNDSSLCLHYLDGFRFQVGGNEYNGWASPSNTVK